MNQTINELIQNTQSSIKHLTTAVNALPKEKTNWSPGGVARTASDMILECISFPGWITATLQGKMPSQEEGKAYKEKLSKELTTVELQLDALKRETDTFCEFISKFPENRLSENFNFPWGTYSTIGVLGFHYWNNTYHLGQINYLQMILGDAEMHM